VRSSFSVAAVEATATGAVLATDGRYQMVDVDLVRNEIVLIPIVK
jgi:hypothetical protein